MDKEKLEKEIENIALPIISDMEYELVDIEYLKENREWYLRIYIDKEDGITLDDCTKVSKRISDKLDEIDPIEESYYLEVSSPGINRVLRKERDFQRAVGKNILIKYFKTFEGKRSVEGILKSFDDEKIILSINGEEKIIDRKLISIIKLNE